MILMFTTEQNICSFSLSAFYFGVMARKQLVHAPATFNIYFAAIIFNV
jgi:hypothetical protein